MKRFKRLTALLLCIFMMFPTQSIAVLGETEGQVEEVVIETADEETAEGVEELLPPEPIERIEETLPLETMETEQAEMVIYWNPGGVLPENLMTASNAREATASNAQRATASNAKRGSDNADGLSPSTPVKTLEAALERAHIMQEEEGVTASDITIYAMNPMEIRDGELYILTGGQIRILSWPGRTYENETIFYVNGGQLTLVNTRLESGNPNMDGEEAGLILVQGGSLQMGQNVEVDGQIVMDYREEKEEPVWNAATPSDASIKPETATSSDADLDKTGSEDGAFNINDYILDSDEETLELQQDSKSASTWREPVIELLEDFYGTEKGYVLDVLEDDSADHMELVKTLYADAESEEAFMELFALSETTDSSWQLTVETQTIGRLRNTSLSDGLAESESLTLKTLVATPFDLGTIVYWNPGGPLTVTGPDGEEIVCPIGDDGLYDGKRPQAPVKTWEKAVENASGGTIICMQSVNLGSANAANYIPVQGDGSFLISSSSSEVMVNLRSWESHTQPAFIVPEGETLVLKDVVLGGIVRDGEENYIQTVLSERGSLIIKENVTADKGYIHIGVYAEMEANPVKVTSADGIYDGKVTLMFGGINDNLGYRCFDVVVPWGDLKASAELGSEEAEAIGKKLNKRFQLHNTNRSTDYGGTSKFDWCLRPDTIEDDGITKPQNLELYVIYYFNAIYLDGEEGRGNDSNDGATCQYPVRTWERAKAVWEIEMEKSIEARGEAATEGKTEEQIEKLYPLPDTIYICGTVTIQDTKTWDLSEWTDYNGNKIITEVVSHVDIPLSEDGINLAHELPKVLVEVAASGILTIEDVRFRGITDEQDSVTIHVADGGALTLTNTATLTGERLESGNIAAKETTLGTHVKVEDGGSFVMDGDWEGAIERRQRGVDASGTRTIFRMESGEIRENDSFGQPGAGVALSEGVKFTMNGGAITRNIMYAYGGGIYMTGDNTTFNMNKGEISLNKMAETQTGGDGIGIYAGTGTILNIGNGITPAEQVIISENEGRRVSGGGIWTDGVLNLNRATVSLNKAGGNNNNYVSYGIGIYISENGTLNMTEGQVVGNSSIESNRYGSANGAGIYFEYVYNGRNLDVINHINKSTISENKIGSQYSGSDSKYSSGGGIYSYDNNLVIKDSVISNNEAQDGGGIYFNGVTASKISKLEIEATDINSNISRNFTMGTSTSGRGGGIFLNSNVILTIKDGARIFDNEAKGSGGGIYMSGESASNSVIDMRSETPGAIQIYKNKSGGSAGGIYVTKATVKAKNVEIIKNIAGYSGGGVHASDGITVYMKNVTVTENEASNGSGGGFYISGSEDTQLKDLEISGNSAVNGGGIYLYSSCTVHLSETGPGDFKLIGNQASENGGGIYNAIFGGELTMDIAGVIQNSAEQQGSNLYITSYARGRMYLLSGIFKQPEEEKRVDGVYNIYLDVEASYTTHGKYFDMSKLTFEKKTEENPQVIYLNTVDSYLTYLTVPENDNYSTFPIDLNEDNFNVGSVVVRPANITSVEYQTPKDDLSGSDKITKEYTPLVNAETNLAYSSGGKLPRRTQLGGFEDVDLINIVLLGEGVYLSGKGNDGNGGTSPVDAVETFAMAKELLKTRIQDADNDASDEDGFVPFIYICGQVDVNSSQVWDLDYRDEEFDTRNQKYKDAEETYNKPIYPAQIRRFTSFVDAPMIQVGDGSIAVEFETECIIIDGMAEAVAAEIQYDDSPVVRVMKNSKATLNGESQIKNNRFLGIEVYGSLILTGEEDEINKQLCNHYGHFVQMHANSSIKMQGFSRILGEGDLQEYYSTVTMPAAIYVSGDDVSIIMEDSSSIEDNTLESFYYYSLVMWYGIQSEQSRTKIIMQDDASIKNTGSIIMAGVVIRGTDQEFTMRDRAQIDGGNAKTIETGMLVGGTRSQIEMCGFSKLSNFEYRGVSLGGTNSSFSMNMNADASDDDSAKILNATNGISINSAKGLQLSMGESALISQATEGGIHFTGGSGTVEGKILMQDNSSISKCESGIAFSSSNSVPLSISMKNNSAIEQNKYGIYEKSSTACVVSKLDLEMIDSSRISGNTNSGIYFGGSHNYSSKKGDYRNITLKDSAVIGGSTYYDSADPESGNWYYSLYSNAPITLNMNGTSKISGNGNTGNRSSFYLTRASRNNNYASGTSKITLSGDASICGNRGRVYVDQGTTDYPNPCEIILDAITEGGTPSIQKNTDAVYLGGHGILKLKGAALLGDTTYEGYNYEKRSLDCYGKLELDGRSIIKGRVYLQNWENPITMTHEVTDPARLYYLWLSEGFISQVVVQPDKVGIMDVTSPDQFTYFHKDGADGVAADKSLMRQSPNIVLLGENNVYLSGYGSDTNDGSSPEKPVRTFKRAKQLLKEGYYTTGANIIICNYAVQVLGADSVLGDDSDWSFDEGGTVRNRQTGDTWKPLVVRYEGYSGRLIQVSEGPAFASLVTFKNITIDGGSEQGNLITSSGNNELLYIETERKAVLGEGAVFQNNQSAKSSSSGNTSHGIGIYGGTLEIDGGIIRNIVREVLSSPNSSVIASVISCESNGSNSGRVIMKSGQIVNNQLICSNAANRSARLGTIHLAKNCQLEMSGGLIADNEVITRSDLDIIAGTIVLYEAAGNISGGIIRDNTGGIGSAIYYYNNDSQTEDESLILSGGQITDNRTTATDYYGEVRASKGEYSSIYIKGWDFQLKGGGADVRDNIYLYSANHIIKVSGTIYQTSRKYHVFLNQGNGTTQFKKGSTVVQPDGNFINDVTPYFFCFQVHSNPYILDIGRTSQSAGTVTNVTERQCLILMKGVYLDSVEGEETNNGTTPKQAVNTFTRAKEEGESGHGKPDYYVIYVSGKAVNTETESVWTLPETAYMCRYTGFKVYEEDGSETPEIEMAYYNFLIEPAYPLKLEQIAIYGRRSMDTIENKGDSLINIKTGIQVTVDEGAILERNYNNGAYVGEEGTDNLISEGGAIRVEAGGELFMKAGTIQDTDAAYGTAIYLEAGKTEGSPLGHLYLSGNPNITGKVYLDGTGSVTAAYIEPDGTYQPTAVLKLSLRNDYNGRPVVSYHDGTPISHEHMEYFVFDDAIKGAYDIAKRTDTILELRIKRAIYLDGKDSKATADGKTPETAFGTLKQVYESIGNQPGTNSVLVFIVNTVEVSASGKEPDEVLLSNILIKESDGSSYYEGAYQDGNGASIDIRGQVYFKRYVKPDGYTVVDPVYDNFNVETHMGALFSVADGGTLTLNGIYVDGHSQDSQNAVDVTLVANGITAMSPLICVDGTGELMCYRSGGPANGVPTATVLTNNINGNNKDSDDDIIGELNGSSIKEGSSAGIELLNGGTCTLQYTEFHNLSLGEKVVSGGTDVYSNGFLHFFDEVFFTGTVYLEGLGTSAGNRETSRYLTVDVYGKPLATDFQVLMRDPYNGRDVVHFSVGITPEATDIGLYRLEEHIKNFFYLASRVGEVHILELQVPVAVYIDGENGKDDQEDRAAGSTPEYPVKSLKRAFDLLRTRGGNAIYVVNTVKMTKNAYITGNAYRGDDGTVLLGSTDKVQITRYIQPDFARNNKEEAEREEYDVEDFTGVLLNVEDDITGRFGANVFFDGHSKPKTDTDYPIGLIVSGESEAKAPLITVAERGTLELDAGVMLQDNNNTHQDEDGGMAGSVLYNSGTTTVNGALFKNNNVIQGADIYQDGTFTILGEPENLAGLSFYLTTKKTGTSESPIWGEDHVIQTAVMIPDGQIFDVDMDHAVKGRDVVRFMDSSAYTPNADAEHEHFRLGETVPHNLFLVEAILDETVLELQDWEVFDVEVPTDIYLVVNQKGDNHQTTRLSGIRTEAEGTSLFSAPEYTIKNKGIYDVQVSVKEFVNQNAEAEITHDNMNLTETRDDAAGNTDIYLAVKGLDDGSDGTGFTMDETSLKPYAEAVVTEAPAKLGVLKAGTDGNFTFVGEVGDGYVEKYLDPDFPIEGKSREEAQQYMDGTSEDGLIHARAKYGLKYKLEMVPSRRGE